MHARASFARFGSAGSKLEYLHRARMLRDLLRRQETGCRPERRPVRTHSIRINDRWRICFVWRGTNAEQVEVVDYH